MSKKQHWSEDLKTDSVDKASEIPPRIELPQPGEKAIEVTIRSQPEEMEVVSRKGETMLVVDAERTSDPAMKGTMILPKSLRFNMAKSLQSKDMDYTNFDLNGSSWRVWSKLDKGSKYYQAEHLA